MAAFAVASLSGGGWGENRGVCKMWIFCVSCILRTTAGSTETGDFYCSIGSCRADAVCISKVEWYGPFFRVTSLKTPCSFDVVLLAKATSSGLAVAAPLRLAVATCQLQSAASEQYPHYHV